MKNKRTRGARKKVNKASHERKVPQEIQIGNEKAVVIPLETWKRAMEELEELYDILAYDRAKAEMEEEDETERIEHDELCRMLGLSPLRYLRNRAGLTQTGLARRARLSQSYIARAEKGERQLSETAAKKIAKALGVPAEKLLID
jgi:DNA-binding XRE family transcriptional regulator